jgi:hypothetical protein
MNERRANQPVRTQAQQWFEVLRAHLAAASTNSDITARLQHWETLEDVLGDCPQLLPPLLTMAWQLRHQQDFSALFLTSSGQIAEETGQTLKISGKSFDQVVLGQLHGAMRLYCERQEAVWLAAERVRHTPPRITTWPLVGALALRLLRLRDEDVVRNYPQHGLYPALKPWLRYQTQFALIEALATLPTSTVKILGDAVRGLTVDGSIRNLAAVETRKCKFITGLARVFADTVISEAQAARTAGTLAAGEGPMPANMAEMTGMSLTQLTIDGLHLAKVAVAVKDHARDIVIKMAPSMGYNLWNVFTTTESAMNVALCPAALARAIGGHAIHVHHRTSESLGLISDQRIIEGVVAGLVHAAGVEALARWAANPNCATGWLRIANEIKQNIKQHGESAVTFETAAGFSQTLTASFAALAGEGPAPATTLAEARPAEIAPAQSAPAASSA